MTIAKYLSIQFPHVCLSEKEIDYLLWNETAYPFGGRRTQVRQLNSAVRAWRRGITRCICGQPEAYCKCAAIMEQVKDTKDD